MIIDDLGIAWYYLKDENRIAILDENGEYVGGGFWCESFEEGEHLLREGGYIS